MTLAPAPWDQAVFTALNSFGREPLDYFCAWPTHFGEPALLAVATLAYMLIWDQGRIWGKFGTLCASIMAGWAAAQVLKHLFFRPRPYVFYHADIERGAYQLNAFFELLSHESSFPSGHTAVAFAWAAALHGLYGKRLAPLYLLAGFIAFTRIYVGVHFPTDVLAGAAVGTLAGFGGVRLLRIAR